MTGLDRRGLLSGTLGAGVGLGLSATAAMAQSQAQPAGGSGTLLNALEFGAAGDGEADDTAALQDALNAVANERTGGLLLIPPGTYRVTAPLRVETAGTPDGDITHGCIVRAYGARIASEIVGDDPVFEFVSRAVVRFLIIEGLEIRGTGQEAHGVVLTCVERGSYIYNFCLRDLTVEACGGDGCRMTGNVFEGQIFNSYFRDNGGNGMTLSHGPENTVVSAVHGFGCVFGGNGIHGVELRDGAQDIGFQGCYFLLNEKFGLVAPNGISLLSHCGFENNQRGADSFADGDAGIRLLVRGTLIGCNAYSIRKQTHLINAYVTNRLTLVGCTGAGGGQAGDAGLARLQGDGSGQAYLVGNEGRVDGGDGIETVAMGPAAAGRFPANWDSPDLARLGSYRLWVDGDGHLRIKDGDPVSDRDGRAVGV